MTETLTRRPTAIEVLEVRAIRNAGALRGFAKVRLGAVVLHGVRIIRQEGRAPYIALPQTAARKKADGSGAGWFPCISITNPELLARVREAVLEAWRVHEGGKP